MSCRGKLFIPFGALYRNTFSVEGRETVSYGDV